MTAYELERLARATCSWLAYRYLIDENTMYERILLIPIYEFLAASTDWKPVNELSYKELFGDKNLSDYYADIAASKKGGKKRFLLETKLLKNRVTSRWNEIENEFIRLAMPTGQLPRYLLIAGPAKFFEIPSGFKPTKEAKIFKRALGFDYHEGFEMQLPNDDNQNDVKVSYVRRSADVSVSVGSFGR